MSRSWGTGLVISGVMQISVKGVKIAKLTDNIVVYFLSSLELLCTKNELTNSYIDLR